MQMAQKHHSDWKPSGSGRLALVSRRWTAPLLSAVIVIGFYWKLVLTNQFTWLASSDLSSMVLPWFQFQASEWHAGRFPLWDPYSWAGQPLLAQAQPGSAYPLNWMLFLVPLKHSWLRQAALNWYYVAIRILAALCFYWFCRDLGRSRRAAVIGGAVYGVAGYLGSIEWPQMVNGAVWAPLVFLFQFRVAEGRRPARSAVLSGFFLGLMWLCGHHQLPLFVSLGSAGLWIYLTFRNRLNASVLRWAAISLAVGILTSGLQTLPTAEYGTLARRWSSTDHPLQWNETVPYAVHEDYSVKPLSLISIVVPGLDVNEDPLIGAVAFALALIGLALAWWDERVRWLTTLALASVLFALGPNSVFHGLMYSITPLVEKARVPAQAMILFHIGICALVAFGVDHFPTLSKRGAAVTALLLAALGLLLSLIGFVLFETHLLSIQGDTRFMVTAFAALLGGALLWSAWNGAMTWRVASLALLGLTLLEVGNTSGYFFASYERHKDRTANLRKMAQDGDIADYLRAQAGRFRVEYDGEVFPHNLGDWWGAETFTSYVASAPDIVLRNEPYHPRVQALLGVRYYLSSKPLRPDQKEVFTGVSGRKVFQNVDAFPRTWSVHQVRRVSVAETGRLLTDPAVDLRKLALVTGAPPRLEQCSEDVVDVPLHQPNRVVIQANMQCRGLVILSETYFPGWSATVDGKAVSIQQADGMLRGVVAEAGIHTIVMQYRPWSVIAGGGMTLLGFVLTLAVALRTRQPRAEPAFDTNASSI